MRQNWCGAKTISVIIYMEGKVMWNDSMNVRFQSQGLFCLSSSISQWREMAIIFVTESERVRGISAKM